MTVTEYSINNTINNYHKLITINSWQLRSTNQRTTSMQTETLSSRQRQETNGWRLAVKYNYR